MNSKATVYYDGIMWVLVGEEPRKGEGYGYYRTDVSLIPKGEVNP